MAPPRSPTELEARRAALAEELGEEISLDGLTRDFHIYQRVRGHRHSTDDLLTAWYAATQVPRPPQKMLDLGTGIGSVGLSLAWRFPDAQPTVVEVQAVSFRLLRENLWANGLEARVRAIHGDLRHALPPGERFELVTGSPPYFDVANGIVPADSQKAAARFELHGDVGDYARAAVQALAPGGRFVFCFPTDQRARAERACADACLGILSSRDVVPRAGRSPLFSLFSCAHAAKATATVREPDFLVRDAAGAHTPELTRARATFGFGEAL